MQYQQGTEERTATEDEGGVQRQIFAGFDWILIQIAKGKNLKDDEEQSLKKCF